MRNMFQHRHYAALASIIADMREEHHWTVCNAPDDIEDRLVKLFAGDNRGFDEDRFRKAARRAPDMHGKDRR